MKRSRDDSVNDSQNVSQEDNNPDKLRRFNPQQGLGNMEPLHIPSMSSLINQNPNSMQENPFSNNMSVAPMEPNFSAVRSPPQFMISPQNVVPFGANQPSLASIPSLQSVLQAPQLPSLSQATGQPLGLPPSFLTNPSMSVGVGPQQPAPQAPSSPPQKQNVRYESALDFLDQVKLQFADNPKVYNQFLDIMKDFKAQAIDTPGVIARVSELFKGHKNLILGFNNFLPPGYKIEYIPEEQPPPPVPVQTRAQMSSVNANPPLPVMQGAPQASVPPGMLQGPNRKQPEFDQARNYVKKIKMRFALQPQIYKAFLEILHTYHKEQHTIKDVYEQVAQLFASHADLLEEFTQFLPDPMAAQTPPPPAAAPPKQKKIPPRKTKAEKPPPMERPERPEREKPERLSQQIAIERLDKSARRAKQRAKEQQLQQSKAEHHEKYGTGSIEEMNFFQKLKQRLNNTNIYYEFLKCLNLFSQGILTRLELAILARELLGRHRDMFEWFQEFIGFDDSTLEALERSQEDKKAQKTQADIDFKQMKRYGPSYRALPKDYIPPVCSGRTELHSSVLNDTWVSVPTGSEDFGFKNMRKNQYEEMLFKCEDDRFELDLVIELNAGTMRVLEPILKQLSEVSEDEVAKFRLDAYLDVLHLRSIERIYGDKGPEVIDAMFTNPLHTIPVILKRLKQKDQEWTKARREWNKIWREVNEKNYYKSLDHQSFYFKQNDKKNLTPKVLIAEIKQKYVDQLKEQGVNEDGTIVVDKVTIPKPMEVDEQLTHHMQLEFFDKEVFQDVFELVSFSAERNTSKSDREKIDTFFKHFVQVFFFIDSFGKASKPQSQGTPPPQPIPSDKMEVESTQKPETSKAESPKTDNNVKNTFYASNSFYVFFRLFHTLFDRLSKAKEFSKKPPAGSTFNYLLDPSKARPEDNDKYKQFLKLIYLYMSGARESGAFEDELRSLFGIQAYMLFTIDRVIIQLTKQVQAMLTEETTTKLLALFSFDKSNNTPGWYTQGNYYTRCVEVLEEERVFKFDFEKQPNFGMFTVRMLDSLSDPPQFVTFSLETGRQETWNQYVERYLGSDEVANLDPKKSRVFLKRNVKKTDDMTEDDLEIENGLECRISLETFKLFFVENTQDFLYRHSRRQAKNSEMAKQDRVNNLTSILEKKFPGQLTSTTTPL